jgi:pilus assembly protein CpaE
MLAAQFRQRTLLMDLDLQFGTLPVYLDLKPRESILDALAAHDHLDALALEGHTTRHASGLRLLAGASDQLALPWEIPREQVGRLLELAVGHYDHVVVDLPRQMDPLTAAVLTRADRVCIVLQQELTHLRDATRLAGILGGDLSVPQTHIDLIVNRHDPGHGVRIQDVREAIKPAGVHTVPSDYQTVSESVNLGTPLLDHARGADITQALVELARRLGGVEPVREKGRLQHAVARFLGM